MVDDNNKRIMAGGSKFVLIALTTSGSLRMRSALFCLLLRHQKSGKVSRSLRVCASLRASLIAQGRTTGEDSAYQARHQGERRCLGVMALAPIANKVKMRIGPTGDL